MTKGCAKEEVSNLCGAIEVDSVLKLTKDGKDTTDEKMITRVSARNRGRNEGLNELKRTGRKALERAMITN